MESLLNYLPKDLVNIVEEYHIPLCDECGQEVFNDYWRVNDGNLVFTSPNCRNWYYYNKRHGDKHHKDK